MACKTRTQVDEPTHDDEALDFAPNKRMKTGRSPVDQALMLCARGVELPPGADCSPGLSGSPEGNSPAGDPAYEPRVRKVWLSRCRRKEATSLMHDVHVREPDCLCDDKLNTT